jgi:DNA-binding protein YbaB
MWLLKFLPDWFFYAILIAGLVGLVATYFLKYLKFIPFISTYTIPVRLGSYAAIVIGLFMAGAIHDNTAWQDRVKEMEAKVAKAEQESKEANQKIDSKTLAVKQKISQNQTIITQYIDREVTKYDSECIIPKEFIKAFNDSVEDPR